MTHAPHRAHGHGERISGRGSSAPSPVRARPARVRAARRPLALVLMLAAFALAMLTLLPGVANAAGESVVGTLSTSKSGPIEGVEVTVEGADGTAVGSVETGDDGRFEVDVPAAGDYTVSIDAGDLPDDVKLGTRGDTVPVTVGAGRHQPVIFGLSDGTTGSGGGGAGRVVQLLVDGLRFGLLIAISAVGLSLIFGTTGLTNFAHGELVTIGAVIAWYINVRGGIPLIPATIIAMVVGAGVGALNELALCARCAAAAPDWSPHWWSRSASRWRCAT